MIAQSPLLLHLTSSFLISTLRLHVEPEGPVEDDTLRTPFILISPNRNISLDLHGSAILADGQPLLSRVNESLSARDGGIVVLARCQHGFAFSLSVGALERIIPSPSFCANHGMNQILIGPDDQNETFYGCIRNITFGPNKILSSWCRLRSSATSTTKEASWTSPPGDFPLLPPPPDLQPVYIGERLKCVENGSVRLMWKNIYLFPEHRRYHVNYADVHFKIVDGPLHGQLLLNGSAVRQFSYDDIINQRLVYVHDGSETTEDSLDFKVWIKGQSSLFLLSVDNPRIYTLLLQIDPVDDPPHLVLSTNGGILNVTPSIPLTNQHLEIWDVDTKSTEVWIDVIRQHGAHLCWADGTRLNRFTLSNFLNRKVYLMSEGSRGEIELTTRSNSSSPVKLRLISAPVRIQKQHNTGLRMPHRSTRLITNSNLSFISNFPELPVEYFVVDGSEYGLVECFKEVSSKGTEEFQICSTFTNKDLAKFWVRYRHTSASRPSSDSFSFKVKCGDQQSPIHHFLVDFIPVSVRVFIEQSLLLNATEQAIIRRRNLLATAYPESAPVDQLVFHVVEPPKFGMLTRQVNGKMRRIGLSSNFTQQHIDDETVVYKLHYAHFSVLNDYFMFRVVTPAVATELLRFDITFIPGGNAIQLVNRTLVVREGYTKQITNSTLWLETSDDSNFVFTIIVQPFFGNLELVNQHKKTSTLNAGDAFTSFDILNKRLFYKHSGQDLRADRIYLQAENLHHAHTQIPFWLEIQVIPENDKPPHLSQPYRLQPDNLTIHVNSERILYHSLFPWLDGDARSSTVLDFFFPELFRDFIICRRHTPEIPVRNFTVADLHSRALMVRHVSLKSKSTQRYLVSDGKHTVQSEIRFEAMPEQFVRLTRSVAPTTRLTSPTDGLIPIKSVNLWAETNVDMDPNAVRFVIADESKGSPFRLLNLDGNLQSVSSFTQLSISQHRVFITPHIEPQVIRLRLSALHLTSDAHFKVEPSAEVEPLQLRFAGSIDMPHSSTFQLDNTVWRLTGRHANQTRFFVHRQPEHGSIVIVVPKSREKTSIPMNGQVSMFTAEQLNSGNLRYLHHGFTNQKIEDWFSVNFTTPDQETYGPFRFQINVVESIQPVLIVVQNISLPWGASSVINRMHLRALMPAGSSENSASTLTYLIVKKPDIGRLLIQGEEVHADESAKFTHTQLQTDQVIYAAGNGEANSVLSTQQQPAETVIRIKTCEQICSEEVALFIRIEVDNLQAPELLRNEPLFVANDQKWALITSRHLHAVDPDSSQSELRYLVWQPTGGHLATVDNQTEPILSFTQESIDARQVVFAVASDSTTKRIGFSFLITDGLHQTNADWFSVERDKDRHVDLDSNMQLNAAPGVLTPIGSDLLRARVLDVPANELIYQVTRPPSHGKLVYENGNRAVSNFTQTDINENRISYSANRMELNAWLVRDYFNFVVMNAKSPSTALENVNSDNDFRFRILLSFAFIDSSRLDTVLTRRSLLVTRGGSVMMNSTFLDLANLANLSDDILLVEIERMPKHGMLEFLDTCADAKDEDELEEVADKTAGGSASGWVKKHFVSADNLHSGRHLLYKHSNGQNEADEFMLSVYALRNERNKRPTKLKVPIQVLVQQEPPDTRVERFRSEIDLISGGSTSLRTPDYKVADLYNRHTELVYEVLQKGSNGVRLTKNGSSTELTLFTQTEVDNGQIRLEHTPAFDDKFDVLVLKAAGHTRVLFVRIEPIDLQLFNHTPITFQQAKTYIVLERKHLGADSNGDRSKIVYNITMQPQNGSLYWVNGEKEVQSFTQKNIDNGEVLYAQLNMNAFQDSFDFVVSNDDIELLQKSSQIIVVPPFEPQTLLTESRSIAQIRVAHLNASVFDGKSPRYLVIQPPKIGRFFLYPNSNETIAFFTQSQIVDGRVLYQSYEVTETVIDNVTLELRADDIQPSRFNWSVRIASILDNNAPDISGLPGIAKKPSPGSPPLPPQPPELNYRFPVLILGFIVLSVVVFSLCRKNKTGNKRTNEDAIPNIGTRELPEIDEEVRTQQPNILRRGPMRRGNDLLDTTVYATCTPASTSIPSMSLIQQASSSVSPRIKAITFESGDVESKQNRPTLSPAYKSTVLSAVTAAKAKNLSDTLKQSTNRLNDNQYWV